MSVFINECNGNLVSQSERYGSPAHPGIAYLYDHFKITTPNRTFWKASYNTRTYNRTAGSLFRDTIFNDAHGHLESAKDLVNTDDPVWNGDKYPSSFPTAASEVTNGYILAADFFKFRGRGLIQTTWRSNYLALVPFITAYNGDNNVLANYAQKWKSLSGDDVCSRSTSADWDTLFRDTDSLVLCESIRRHAEINKYPHVASATEVVNGEGRGSLIFMGERIGGPGYGELLKRRVRGMCHTLGK